MLRTNPKVKFNSLFNQKLVDDFQSQISLPDGFSIFSKEYTMQHPKFKTQFIQRLGYLCQSKGNEYLGDYLTDSVAFAHDPSMYGYENQIDYIYIRDSRGKNCAVLLAHRGECKEVPSWWTVRLICNNNQDKVCKGMAAILLGLYTYVLKYKQVQPYGLLEVADGYGNIGGYCLYSRFGFEETTIKCKQFVNDVIMANNIKQITYDQIIETVNTGKQQIPDTGSTLYCQELKQASKENRLPLPRDDPKFKVIREEDSVRLQEGSSCIIL